MSAPPFEPTAIPEVNQMLNELLDRVSTILSDRFVGFYFYGSLATGDFTPGRSDIDFVVVTDELLPQKIIDDLEIMHQELMNLGGSWARKLEGAFIPLAVLRRHDKSHHPLPTMHEGKFYLGDLQSDWIIQRYVLREYGVKLAGPSLVDYIDPVDKQDLRRAVLDLLKNIWEPVLGDPANLERPGYQPFAVQTMCRALFLLESGAVVSKMKSDNWVVNNLPDEWLPLIRHASAWRAGDEIESIARTLDFIRFTLDRSGVGEKS